MSAVNPKFNIEFDPIQPAVKKITDKTIKSGVESNKFYLVTDDGSKRFVTKINGKELNLGALSNSDKQTIQNILITARPILLDALDVIDTPLTRVIKGHKCTVEIEDLGKTLHATTSYQFGVQLKSFEKNISNPNPKIAMVFLKTIVNILSPPKKEMPSQVVKALPLPQNVKEAHAKIQPNAAQINPIAVETDQQSRERSQKEFLARCSFGKHNELDYSRENNVIGSGKIKADIIGATEVNRLCDFLKKPAQSTDNFFLMGYGSDFQQKWPKNLNDILSDLDSPRTVSSNLFDPGVIDHAGSILVEAWRDFDVKHSDKPKCLDKFSANEFRCGIPTGADPELWTAERNKTFESNWSEYVEKTMQAGKNIYLVHSQFAVPPQWMVDTYNKAKEKYPNQIFYIQSYEGVTFIAKDKISENSVKTADKFVRERLLQGGPNKPPVDYIEQATKTLGNQFEFLPNLGSPSKLISDAIASQKAAAKR